MHDLEMSLNLLLTLSECLRNTLLGILSVHASNISSVEAHAWL